MSKSSPPRSHGVGSSSSLECTQRTFAPAFSSPVASVRSSSATRLSTVSIALALDQPLPRLAEYGAQDALDLLELLAVGDQRG